MTQTQTTRKRYDARGVDPNCACCKASGNPRGCHAQGHYRPTSLERAAAAETARNARLERELNPKDVCPVCGSSYCLERRRQGRPILCD